MNRRRQYFFLAGLALILAVAGGCSSTPEAPPSDQPRLDAATILQRSDDAVPPARIEELDRDLEWVLSRRQAVK